MTCQPSSRAAVTSTGPVEPWWRPERCACWMAGPPIGDLGVQRIGIVGCGIGLPIKCLLVARVFAEPAAER